LQTELVNVDGQLIEEVKFADITIGDNIAADSLKPSVDLTDFTWYKESARYQVTAVETGWISDDLPAGFRAISSKTETATGSSEPGAGTMHIVYSDGVATVSVFIESSASEDKPGWAILGASNSYSRVGDGFRVTAVGEVPGITVQRIATSMRKR